MGVLMFTKILVAATPLIAFTLLLGGCSRPAPTEEPIRAVKVLTVGVEGMRAGGEFAGEVRARVESRLGFRVAARSCVDRWSWGSG
jgi:multidrug efflux system membrane fusion protein